MWCLETLHALNNESGRLASAGLPEAGANKSLGILPISADGERRLDNDEATVCTFVLQPPYGRPEAATQ